MKNEDDILRAEIETLKARLDDARDRYWTEIAEIEDLALEASDRRAAREAAKLGIKPGVVMKLTRPMLWHGKMTPDLVVSVHDVRTGWNDDPWNVYAFIRLKSGGWSKEPHMIPASWAEPINE